MGTRRWRDDEVDLDEATRMARGLMDEHGLRDWRLVVDRAKTRAGVCRGARREIGLSGPLTRLHSEAEVRDTVLHEIAHALVGPSHGHDAVWRAKARELGCSAQRCVSPESAKVPGRWEGRCPAGHVSTRHRRPERVMSCSRCSRAFDPRHLLEWRHDGRLVPMPPRYAAELRRVLREGQAPAPVPASAPAPGWPPGSAPARPHPVRVGDAVVLGGRGRYAGTVGTVVKRGRTRWHVRTPLGLVTAPFEIVLHREDPRVRATAARTT